MTPFMLRVAAVVGCDGPDEVMPVPATRLSAPTTAGVGADRKVAVRSLAELRTQVIAPARKTFQYLAAQSQGHLSLSEARYLNAMKLWFCAAACFRAPKAMTWADFRATLLDPWAAADPGFEAAAPWSFRVDGRPVQPAAGQTLVELGVGHKSLIELHR